MTKRTSARMRKAVEQEDLTTVRNLLQQGEDINSLYDSSTYWTLLAWSASNGSADLVSLLLENGADVEIEDLEGNTPLILAVLNGHLNVVELLLDYGADIMHETRSGWNALNYAQSKNYERIVEHLRNALMRFKRV